MPDTRAPQAILDTVAAENRTLAHELLDREKAAPFLRDDDAAFLKDLIARPALKPFRHTGGCSRSWSASVSTRARQSCYRSQTKQATTAVEAQR
jgi:hypothetical protein